MPRCSNIGVATAFFIAAVMHGSITMAQPSRNCDEIKVKAEVQHTTSPGKNDGKVTFKFEVPQQSDKYNIFLQCLGCAEPRPGDKEGFSALKAGYYDIYLIDKKGCSKQLNVQVK